MKTVAPQRIPANHIGGPRHLKPPDLPLQGRGHWFESGNAHDTKPLVIGRFRVVTDSVRGQAMYVATTSGASQRAMLYDKLTPYDER